MKASVIKALQDLNDRKGETFIRVLRHGSMSVELYRPLRTDPQKPHEQDELYVIVSGSGKFMLEGEYSTIKTGDVIFVPAGAQHRFEDFTSDFVTWVIFYGPEGGEKQDGKE